MNVLCVGDILIVSRGLDLLLWKESKLNFRIWAAASVSKACVFPQLLTQKNPALLCEPIEMQQRLLRGFSRGPWVTHGICLGCAPLSKSMIGTWAQCDKFPSWMRHKGLRPIGAARENWVAPFREGIQFYPSTFPHNPSLHSIRQNRNGTGKSGELCLNPGVRSWHGDMYQVVL